MSIKKQSQKSNTKPKLLTKTCQSYTALSTCLIKRNSFDNVNQTEVLISASFSESEWVHSSAQLNMLLRMGVWWDLKV